MNREWLLPIENVNKKIKIRQNNNRKRELKTKVLNLIGERKMKRIRKVVASALTLMMSILVMCVGVYAAASAPKVSISGTISYDVGAAKVRVIGNLSGAYTDANGSGINAVPKTETDNNSQPCHYYGVHDNAQSETNMLPAWNIGSVYFKETADGAESFVITLKVENLSVYPIKATVNTTATEQLTNVTKSLINNDAEIAVGGSAEIQVKYDVTNSSQTATLNIGNELVFTKIDSVSNVENLQYSTIVQEPKSLTSYQEFDETDKHYYGYSARIVNAPSGSKVTVKAEATMEDILALGVTEVIITRQSAETLEELISNLDTSKVLDIDFATMSASFETETAQEEISVILNSTNKFEQSYIAGVVSISVEEQGALRFTAINNGEAYEVGIKNLWVSGDVVIPSEYNGKPVTRISGFNESVKSDPTSPGGILFGFAHEGIDANEFVGRPINTSYEELLQAYTALVGGAENVPAEIKDKDNFFWGGFAGATINSLTIPSSITTIGEKAFYECEIGNFIVNGNSNYESKNGALIEKSSKTLIKVSNAFSSVPNDILVIGSYAFGNFETSNLVIPSTVTSIEPYAFAASSFDNLTINANIDSLSGYTFTTTIIVKSLILPNTLQTISSKAICNCYMYGQITIPSSVKIISDNAFYSSDNSGGFGFIVDKLKFEDISTLVDCSTTQSGLNPDGGSYSLTIMNEEPILASGVIELARHAASVYVPASAVDAYKTAQEWSDCAGYIYPIA